MLQKKEKIIKYQRDSQEERERILEAQGESEKIKHSFIKSADLEE